MPNSLHCEDTDSWVDLCVEYNWCFLGISKDTDSEAAGVLDNLIETQ